MMHCADKHIRSMLAIQSQPSNDMLQRSYCRLRSCIRPWSCSWLVLVWNCLWRVSDIVGHKYLSVIVTWAEHKLYNLVWSFSWSIVSCAGTGDYNEVIVTSGINADVYTRLGDRARTSVQRMRGGRREQWREDERRLKMTSTHVKQLHRLGLIVGFSRHGHKTSTHMNQCLWVQKPKKDSFLNVTVF